MMPPKFESLAMNHESEIFAHRFNVVYIQIVTFLAKNFTLKFIYCLNMSIYYVLNQPKISHTNNKFANQKENSPSPRQHFTPFKW